MKTAQLGKGVDAKELSDRELIWRLLGLTWQYRSGCIRLLFIQILLLSIGVGGLSLQGLGVDYVKYQTHLDSIKASAPVSEGGAGPTDLPSSSAPSSDPMAGTMLQPASRVPDPPHQSEPTAKVAPAAKPPHWPLGLVPPDHWSRIRVMMMIALAIIGFAIVTGFLNFLNASGINRLVQGKIVVDLRAKVYDALQRLSFSFFDANASGSIINRVTGDTQSVRSFVDGVLMPTVMLCLSVVVYLVYMLRIHVGLTCACLGSIPLMWLFTTKFSKSMQPAYKRERELIDEQILTLTENVNGVHVVKCFSLQQQQEAKFAGGNKSFLDQKRWMFRRISFFHPVMGMLAGLNIVIMLAYGGYLVVRYEQAITPDEAKLVGISIGSLLIFNGLLQQFSNQVNNIANIANTIQNCLAGARRLFEVLDTKSEIQSPASPHSLSRVRGNLTFQNVSFSYGKASDRALQNISLDVKAGQCIAFLGTTGSGKSTLLSLIPRFYDPDEGSILLDGVDLRKLDLVELRRSVGMVFQESFLFSNTVAANIAFGRVNATEEEIRRAARLAAAHDFIMAMPEGYNTVLREGGANLSGGQRQRLAIARAIITDPAILLMDEPTAAVDPATEGEILGAIDQVMEGRTTFIIAHRLSTLRRADLVVVLEDGRIVERGTHDELMQAHGHYQKTAELQLADGESLHLLGMNPTKQDVVHHGG